MDNDPFDRIAQTATSRGAEAVFDSLIQEAREQKNYRLMFGARLMQARHALGLPLIEAETIAELPSDVRPAYEQRFIQAARETGRLFLEDGNIAAAWPYFKAIGETEAVTSAIDDVRSGEGLDRIIEIAFEEGANPRKGFELILQHHGICHAITVFARYRDMASRQHCLQLLVRTLYRELAASLKETITSTGSAGPVSDSVAGMIEGRDWLFEGNSYYVDSTHLTSILRFTPELEDVETLRMAAELADYGRRLAPMFHFREDPPFENTYTDYAMYLHGLLSEDVDAAITHFTNKAASAEGDPTPAEVLVEFLTRLKRYDEAIRVAVLYLRDFNNTQLSCPSAIQLCQMAGDYKQLRDLARQDGDLLSFTAAVLQDRK